MRRLFPLVLGTIWLYVALSFVYFLPAGFAVRIVVAAALLLIAEYHTITSRWLGSFSSPELPRALLLFLAWAFGGFLFLTVLLLLRDVVGSVAFAFAPQAGRAILGGATSSLIVGALAAALSLFGVWQGVKVPSVRRMNISIAGLPAAFNGYGIVQLSDLHASRLLTGRWMAAVVAKANQLAPDLIVITGDIADGTLEARAADVQPLSELHAGDGVLAIPGNHEYYSDYRRWMAAYRGLGLYMLENQHVVIARGEQALVVAGVTDRQALRFGELRPDLAAALHGIPHGTPVVLLDHHPGNAPTNARANVALQLSGHTHGGQIIGLHWLVKRSNNGYVSGRYQVGRMQLYVSNGTGLWNGLALRLGRPSEITELVLHSAHA